MATGYYQTAGREVNVGAVLSHAFGVIGSAPLTFFGVSFVLAALPSALVKLAPFAAALVPRPGTGTPLDGGAIGWIIGAAVGAGIAWLLFYLAAQAVLFRVAAAQLDGRPERFGSHAGAAARALLPFLGLSILLTLAVWFGLVLLVVPGIMLAIIWSVAGPALVIERIGVFASMSRSRYLTRGARWRVFGLVVLVYAIYFVASSALSLASFGLTGLAGDAAARVQPPIVATLVSVILQTAFVAVWTAIQAALYVELRDWKDGPVGDRLTDIFA